MTEEAAEMIDALAKENRKLGKENAALRAKVDALESRVKTLEHVSVGKRRFQSGPVPFRVPKSVTEREAGE